MAQRAFALPLVAADQPQSVQLDWVQDHAL
jgi:hypothetical protein